MCGCLCMLIGYFLFFFIFFFFSFFPSASKKCIGPTCPFVPTALKKNSVYVCRVRTYPNTTKEQIIKVIENFIDKFFELEPKKGALTS